MFVCSTASFFYKCRLFISNADLGVVNAVLCLIWTGAWPFVARVSNLPDSLSTHPANVHLFLLAPNEYWELDRNANTLRRRVRQPKSLMPHLHLVVDDLMRAYHKGVRTVDASVPPSRPGRIFRCRVCLLLWTGDYPAQAAVSGTHSKCCHWCNYKSVHTPEVNRQCWGDYRRFLRMYVLTFNFACSRFTCMTHCLI